MRYQVKKVQITVLGVNALDSADALELARRSMSEVPNQVYWSVIQLEQEGPHEAVHC